MTSLDIVIPVLNEEQQLPVSVPKLVAFLERELPGHQWRVIVGDNGSTDGTPAVCKRLAEQYPGKVTWSRIEQRGRGRMLRKAWGEGTADICAYMDVDLSTGLEALPLLVRAIDKEGYHIAIGSRLMKGARVEKRPLKREITSRGYNWLIKLMFWTRFSDAQCGFKALSRRVVSELLPLTKDTGWFLDSEVLIIAEKNGYRIKDVPVHWVDDPDTRVKVVKTAWGDIKGLMRLRFKGIPRAKRQ